MRMERIKSLLQEKIQPLSELQVEDESHKHAGRQGQESHFKIFLVSTYFTGKNRVQRQREINELLQEEFESGLHALSMRLMTPGEYAASSTSFQSPNCQGSKQSQ